MRIPPRRVPRREPLDSCSSHSEWTSCAPCLTTPWPEGTREPERGRVKGKLMTPCDGLVTHATEDAMRATNRSLEGMLVREEREMQRRFSTLRRVRQWPVGMIDVPDRRRTSLFDAAAVEVLEQHRDLLWQRLADRSRAVTAAKD